MGSMGWDGMGWFGMGCCRVGWGGMGSGRVGRLLRLGLQDALQGDVEERREEHLGEGAERHLRLLWPWDLRLAHEP